uniref:Dual specificity protein phosphatase n=2 Tax=Dromaius novaehollandiae TaxID=8790 RepID=A0A8C4J3J8_DRONO
MPLHRLTRRVPPLPPSSSSLWLMVEAQSGMAWDSLCRGDLLRPKIRSASGRTTESQSSYKTPSLEELRRLLWTRTHPTGHVDEVWPNLYVGDLYVARDKAQLSRMGISHVVDAAAGRFRIDTGPKFYKDLLVDYYGIEAEDSPNFDISIYFYPVARYIRAALKSPRGVGKFSDKEKSVSGSKKVFQSIFFPSFYHLGCASGQSTSSLCNGDQSISNPCPCFLNDLRRDVPC